MVSFGAVAFASAAKLFVRRGHWSAEALEPDEKAVVGEIAEIAVDEGPRAAAASAVLAVLGRGLAAVPAPWVVIAMLLAVAGTWLMIAAVWYWTAPSVDADAIRDADFAPAIEHSAVYALCGLLLALSIGGVGWAIVRRRRLDVVGLVVGVVAALALGAYIGLRGVWV
jgi:hypothetical protein